MPFGSRSTPIGCRECVKVSFCSYDQTVTHLGKFFAVVGTKAYRTLKRSSVVFLGYAVRFLIAYLLWSVLSIILRPVLIGFAEEFHIIPKSSTDVACNEKEKQD